MHAPAGNSLPFAVALVFLAIIGAGCSIDQTPFSPAKSSDSNALEDALRPGTGDFAATDAWVGRGANLRNIWPNDDGRLWVYQIEQRQWGELLDENLRIYPIPQAVPPAPRLTQVAALLYHQPIGPNPVRSSADYLMQFNGMKTTLSGAVGQNLETTVLDIVATTGNSTSAATTPAHPTSVASAGISSGFLRALSRARPDLAKQVLARYPEAMRAGTSFATSSTFAPLFLDGYAWVKTSEYIGGYGDLNTDLSYKYLDANLRPGSSFSMQLVPDLATDVFLYARVIGERPIRTPAGNFRGALEVLYLIDFGVSALTDINGNPLGYWRVYSYGTILYVPNVGPVASYERGYVQPGRPLDPGQYDLTIRLISTAPGPVAN